MYKRRYAVCSESLNTPSRESSRAKLDSTLSEKQLRLIMALSQNPLTRIHKDKFPLLVFYMAERSTKKGDVVITKGDRVADEFFIVDEGTFVTVEEPHVVYESGQSFGEMALIHDCPRAATVVCASEEGNLWVLDRLTFRRIIMVESLKKRALYTSFLRKVPLLSNLTEYELENIADALEAFSIPAGAVVFQEGDAGDRFYIIRAGEVTVHSTKFPDPVTLGPGDYFGELALLSSARRISTIETVNAIQSPPTCTSPDNLTCRKQTSNCFRYQRPTLETSWGQQRIRPCSGTTVRDTQI